MKKLVFSLLAVAFLSMVSCKKEEPQEPQKPQGPPQKTACVVVNSNACDFLV